VTDPTLYLFDGYNVLHAGSFGDRDELVDVLASFVAARGARERGKRGQERGELEPRAPLERDQHGRRRFDRLVHAPRIPPGPPESRRTVHRRASLARLPARVRRSSDRSVATARAVRYRRSMSSPPPQSSVRERLPMARNTGRTVDNLRLDETATKS